VGQSMGAASLAPVLGRAMTAGGAAGEAGTGSVLPSRLHGRACWPPFAPCLCNKMLLGFDLKQGRSCASLLDEVQLALHMHVSLAGGGGLTLSILMPWHRRP